MNETTNEQLANIAKSADTIARNMSYIIQILVTIEERHKGEKKSCCIRSFSISIRSIWNSSILHRETCVRSCQIAHIFDRNSRISGDWRTKRNNVRCFDCPIHLDYR